jgi:hypothetical protein
MSARSSAETKAWISNIALGVGAIGVGLGGWILLHGHGEHATGVAVRGAAAPDGVRVSLEDTF